jgi:hypothetical protein
MKSSNIYILGLAFVFLLLQSSIVWVNEEILLVISFVLFYVICYLQLRESLTEFFVERRNSFQNNFFLFLKDLAMKDLKAQKEFQYFKNMNLAHLAMDALAKENLLFDLTAKNLQESKKIIFEKRCLNVLHFEESYKAEMLDLLTADLLQELFVGKPKKTPHLRHQFFLYQISLLKSKQSH